jgi:phage-related protein
MRKLIAFGNYYHELVSKLNAGEQHKLEYILTLMGSKDRMPEKFIKFVRDGLYELRLDYSGNAYRLFFIFDEDAIVVVFNWFQKKTQKTPEREIRKALRIREEYYASKQSHDHRS